jgi:hypothetical protein
MKVTEAVPTVIPDLSGVPERDTLEGQRLGAKATEGQRGRPDDPRLVPVSVRPRCSCSCSCDDIGGLEGPTRTQKAAPAREGRGWPVRCENL